MKVPLNWLNEYVDISGTSPERLAEILTMRGLEVDSLKETDGGIVIDIELTPNRGDCASVIGVARETAAALERDLKIPKVDYEVNLDNGLLEGGLEVNAPEKCPAYYLKMLEGIKIKESPDFIKERLRGAGLRPLNNVIDITNYVMLETGQPLHAFDADKISTAKVIVREAEKGEILLMLDGATREFKGGEVVIADINGPIAVGGVMGGEDSSVTEATEKILVESAYFTPQSISRTEKKLNVKTDASYRFARGTDKENILYALHRAVGLIQKYCSGISKDEIIGFNQLKNISKTVKVSAEKVNSLLGSDIDPGKMKDYLTDINFKAEIKDGNIVAQVPTYRNDVQRPVDIIEEIARVHGYDNIEEKLPKKKIESNYYERPDILAAAEEFLRADGYWESVTHTLTDSDNLNQFYNQAEKDIVMLENPVSVDLDCLRPSLLPGLLKVAAYNENRRSRYLKFYERGPVFYEKSGDYREMSRIAYLAAQKDYFDVKSVAEGMLNKLKQQYEIVYDDELLWFESKKSASLKIDGKRVGAYGVIKKEIAKIYGTNSVYVGGYINIAGIENKKITSPKFKMWSEFPDIYRDLSLICPIQLTHKNIYDTIKSKGSDALKEVEVVDSYTGENLQPGKKSITYALKFNSEKETLSSERVDSLIKDILKELNDKHGVTLRAE